MTTPEPVTAAELQREIEQTRERLGETVEELAAKVDVKARAQAKAAEAKAKAQAKAAEVSGWIRQSQEGQPRWPLVVTAAGVVIMGAAVVWRWQQT